MAREAPRFCRGQHRNPSHAVSFISMREMWNAFNFPRPFLRPLLRFAHGSILIYHGPCVHYHFGPFNRLVYDEMGG